MLAFCGCTERLQHSCPYISICLPVSSFKLSLIAPLKHRLSPPADILPCPSSNVNHVTGFSLTFLLLAAGRISKFNRHMLIEVSGPSLHHAQHSHSAGSLRSAAMVSRPSTNNARTHPGEAQTIASTRFKPLRHATSCSHACFCTDTEGIFCQGN